MAEPVRRRRAAILLVDDESLVRRPMASALRRGGHDEVEVRSADDALVVLRDPARPVDPLITDVRMPSSVRDPKLARLAGALRLRAVRARPRPAAGQIAD